MRIGDTIESAIWLDGRERPQDRAKWEGEVRDEILKACRDAGFLSSPVRFIEKKPGDDRVPEVPDHIQGPDVRLLIGEADVLCRAPEVKSRRFVGDLDRKDLARLRQVTRRVHAKYRPGEALSDAQCDDIIEAQGPEAAMEAVRKAVNGQTLH